MRRLAAATQTLLHCQQPKKAGILVQNAFRATSGRASGLRGLEPIGRDKIHCLVAISGRWRNSELLGQISAAGVRFIARQRLRLDSNSNFLFNPKAYCGPKLEGDTMISQTREAQTEAGVEQQNAEKLVWEKPEIATIQPLSNTHGAGVAAGEGVNNLS
jgi:hypothetical protein